MVFELLHRNATTRILTFEKVNVDTFSELLQAAESRAMVDNFKMCTIISDSGDYLADVMQARDGRMMVYGFPIKAQ